MSEYSTVFGDTDNLPDTQEEEEMKSKKANNKSLVTNNGD